MYFSLFNVSSIHSIKKSTKKQKIRNKIEGDTEGSLVQGSKERQRSQVNKLTILKKNQRKGVQKGN